MQHVPYDARCRSISIMKINAVVGPSYAVAIPNAYVVETRQEVRSEPCDLGIVLRVQGMGVLTCLRPYVLTHLDCLRLTLHGCLRAVVIDDCR
jgi:hypothetical protein